MAVVVALAVIPVTHRFSDTFDATHEFGTVSLIAPTGSAVALSWAVTGGPASIQVFNGNGQILDASEAPVGSFSFSSTTPSDGFEANSTGTASVSVSWSYASPIL